jgi:pimeloyl-ACP methyl ester carboxylesterase
MTAVVLVHGWGYDASIWDAVRARLSAALHVETIDLGYFGAERFPELGSGETAIAVGHSLGALWWLTKSGVSWHRLLCINGFPRFTAAEGYPGVAPRVLHRMRRQFEREPTAVLADFHTRCGAPAPATTLDEGRLATGLVQLADLDGRAALAARAADVWALACADDPIVPRAMCEAAFAALTVGRLEFVAASGHLLPLTDSDLCAQWIERLAR